MVTCWERAVHLALVFDVKLSICHFSMWYPGSDVVLDFIDPDLCPFYYIVPINMHCLVFFL